MILLNSWKRRKRNRRIIIIKKNYSEKRLRESADHAARNLFKSIRSDERDRRDVDEQSKRNQCVLNEFCENQNENEHKNEQDKKVLWVKEKELNENDVVNDINEVIHFDKKRDASKKRWWNERIELLLEKTNNKIKRNSEKIEKNNRKNDQHDWKEHLSENYFQERRNRIFDVFDARDQRAFETTTQQKDEINNINQRKLKDEENAKNERNENSCVDTRIKHDEYAVCTKEYRQSQKI